MSDHTFCRLHLREVMKDVVEMTTPEQRKAAWGYKYQGQQSAEFHGPDGFYWNGRAHCVWEAKAKGWEAWMEKQREQAETGA